MRDRGDGIYPVLQPFAVRSVYFPSLFSKFGREIFGRENTRTRFNNNNKTNGFSRTREGGFFNPLLKFPPIRVKKYKTELIRITEFNRWVFKYYYNWKYCVIIIKCVRRVIIRIIFFFSFSRGKKISFSRGEKKAAARLNKYGGTGWK